MAFNYQAIINSLNNFASKYGLTVYAYTPNFKGIVDAIDNLQNIQFTVEDGTIVNADVNANAAIAGTKINPNFGNQTVVTTSNLGIGNSVSRGKLHVGADFAAGATDAASINLKQTSTTASTGIYLERSGEQKGYYIYLGGNKDSLTFQRNNAGTKSDVMALDRDGNVGIGTSSPGQLLHLSSSGFPTIRVTDADNSTYFDIANSDGDIILKADEGNSFANSAIRFMVDSTERMRIDSSGKVGIGTTSPSNMLHIEGSSPSIRLKETSGPRHMISPFSGNLYIEADPDNTSASTNTIFTVDGNERMRIDSSGRVGIGNTAPSALATGRLVVGQGTSSETITIYSSSTSNGNIHFADGTSGQDRYRGYITYQHTDNYMAFGTNDIERMRILSSGGLTFNGDTATANALDDYEEGSWSPTIKAWNGSYTTQNGTYVKIGKMVFCQGEVITNGSTGTYMDNFPGPDNLPFVPGTDITGGSNNVSQRHMGTGTVIAQNASMPTGEMAFVTFDNGGGAALFPNNISTTQAKNFSKNYISVTSNFGYRFNLVYYTNA